MPRTERQKSKTAIYHIWFRGINRQRIFEEDTDYYQFLEILESVKKRSGFSLYAYCLMDNHVHLLIKENAEPISTIVKRLGARYVFWYNRKYKRCGHLFQDRYKSDAIEDDAHFIVVLRYILQNPVRAGICGRADEYKWCSLGSATGALRLVDESELMEIIQKREMKRQVGELLKESPYMDGRRGRKARHTDEEATRMMENACGVSTVPEFQRMRHEEQQNITIKLYRLGLSIRQLARVTGFSKGIVEKWLKKDREAAGGRK
jgi:REP element-mobilizing transposase RayT